jgi:hypothetical protein
MERELRGARIVGGLIAAVVLAAGPVSAGAAAEPLPPSRDVDDTHAQVARRNLDPADRSRVAAEVAERELRASRLPQTGRQGEVAVVVEGDDRAVDRAVAEAGGRVAGQTEEGVSAFVPSEAIAELGQTRGVEHVRIDPAPIALETSEGSRPVAEWPGATNASLWHDAVPTAHRGADVNIGIIDMGFAGLAGAPDHPLPTLTQDLCSYDGFAADAPDHGTAVLEIVFDMAPDANYLLVCIDQESDLEPAVDFLHANNVKIVNMSLGFTDGRGDGSYAYEGQAAHVVEQSRLEYGMLWIVAAGNQADSHYMAPAGDADGDNYVEIRPDRPFAGELNEILVFAVGAESSAALDVRWDSWHGAPRDYDLLVRDASTGALVSYSQNPQTDGATPWETVTIDNPGPDLALYFVEIVRYSAPATPIGFDVFAFGSIVLLVATDAAQSLTEPATSPYAMAVGAHCFRGTETESFSSRGPTIDGRVKPDISAPDGVETARYGPATSSCDAPDAGFFGTSAAAPHVAGAAAVLLGANPGLGPTELQALLEASANGTPTTDPEGQTNDAGWGQLTLPTPVAAPAPPAGALYAGTSPVRILDTRPGSGVCAGPCTPIGPGQTRDLDVVGLGGLPIDATAVVLNVTAVSPTAASHLSVFPTGQAVPSTSSLNFGAGEVVANHVTATVGLGGAITLFNASGQVHVVVDLAGYYSPTAGTLGLVALSPGGRLMDTRPSSCVGQRCRRLEPGETIAMSVRGETAGGTAIPATAEAVILNMTGVKPTLGTHVSVWPDGPAPRVSSLNLVSGAVRANLVVARIGSDGAIRIRNSAGRIDLVVDVVGWYAPGGAAYVALNPRRILDTRSGNGRFGALTAGAEYDLQARGVNSVPSVAIAALMNVTAVAPSGAGHVTVFPDGPGPPPGTSTLNFVAGQVVPNAVVSAIGPTGRITIYNRASPATPIVVELAGYFRAA